MNFHDVYWRLEDLIEHGKFYAGIGSRETPPNVCAFMTIMASYLEDQGMILRSGGAPKADQAFYRGIKNIINADIYLPWKGFEGSQSDLFTQTPAALKLAKRFHPAWHRIENRQGAQKMMARNSHQVLGVNLQTPVNFVLCWTRDGGPPGVQAKQFESPITIKFQSLIFTVLSNRESFPQ